MNNQQQLHDLYQLQKSLREEFCEDYGLLPKQVAFAGTNPEPIFDLDALNLLRLMLTDISDCETTIVERVPKLGLVSASCKITLSDGRTVNAIGSSQYETSGVSGEILFDGTIVTGILEAQNLAMARALRRALRAAGVNLVDRHKARRSGEAVAPVTVSSPEQKTIAEIHILAREWGHITSAGDDTAYRFFLSDLFGGRTSSTSLNEIERSQLIATYRSMLSARKKAA